MLQKLMKIERKFAWSFLGVVIAIPLAILALYAFFHEKTPAVTYVVQGASDVLDIQAPVEDLRILFQDRDIKEEGRSLKLFSVRVENTGETDILQTHFDETEPWGLKISSGEVIRPRVVDANSEYLRRRLKPSLLSENSINFPKVILERDKSFMVEFLCAPRPR